MHIRGASFGRFPQSLPVIRLARPSEPTAWFSQDWFATRIPPDVPSRSQLEGVLGISGTKVAEAAGEKKLRLVYGYVHSRGLQMKSMFDPYQEEIVGGLLDFLGAHHSSFHTLYHSEAATNRQIVWRPGGSKHRAGHLFELLVHQCRELLDPRTAHDEYGGFFAQTTAFRSRRAAPRIHLSDFTQLFARLAGGHTKARALAQDLMGMLPGTLDLPTTELLSYLLIPKHSGYALAGAPGRLALFPTREIQDTQQKKSARPKRRFLLAYLPVDPGLSETLRSLDLLAHRKEARHEKHGGQEPGTPYFSLAGIIPEALAFARCSIYRDGKKQSGVIDLIQSDATQHAREYAPADLCRGLIPLVGRFLSTFAVDAIFFPNTSTVLDQAELTELDPARRRQWNATMRGIYGEAPQGFESRPVLYRGRSYFVRHSRYPT